jgi:hypothetical protein
MNVSYVGVPEHGLPLITPEDPSFPELALETLAHRNPVGDHPDRVPAVSALLVNETRRAIVALSYVWTYTTKSGRTFSHRHSNLGSGMQVEVLTGRAKVHRDPYSFILEGSRRLITEDGMYGNNLDVLPDPVPRGGGFVGCGGGGRRQPVEDLAAVELSLDFAVLEDGVCVGPDTSGMMDSIQEQLDQQESLAGLIVSRLRGGATAGEVFDLLRPLARRDRARGADLLSMFVHASVHHLIRLEDRELMEWFERAAQPATRRLRRGT